MVSAMLQGALLAFQLISISPPGVKALIQQIKEIKEINQWVMLIIKPK